MTWEHLTSDRLTYDRLVDADVDDVFAVYSDARTWTHFPEGRFVERERAAQLVARSHGTWDALGLGHWAVREDGAFVGTVGVSRTTLASGQVVLNLGYRLAPSAWGRGIATEAARTVVDVVAQTATGLALTARVLSSNPASVRVLEHLGLDVVWQGRSAECVDAPATATRERLIFADRPLDDATLTGLIALG